jgi:hypothetical protein
MIWNYSALGSIMVRWSTHGDFRMRKLIIATTALAFIASPAFAQSTDKSGSAPAATSGDTGTMKKTTKTKKAKKSSSMKKSDDATTSK